MAKKAAPMTVGEYLRQREADPEWVQKRAEQERARVELEAQLRAAQALLLHDLAQAGFPIKSIYDLVNTSSSYTEAIPVLLDHLRRPYPDPVREGIARALAVRKTRKLGWKILVDEYCQTEAANRRMKGAFAAALSGAADDSVLQELIALARDKRHGSSRILLLSGIKRSKLPEAQQAIAELADDPELALEIKSWRKRSR